MALNVTKTFQRYQGGGVVSGAPSPKHNHAVTVIGWGSQDGLDYWLIQNSWGAGWGDHGFVKVVLKRQTHSMIIVSSRLIVY